jgi:hypothetical protein
MPHGDNRVKKHLLAVAVVCAVTAGLATTSFAQTTSPGGAGAGSTGGANGTQSDTTPANPPSSGTGAGTAGASAGTASSSGSTGMGSSIANKGRDTMEDRVPHN